MTWLSFFPSTSHDLLVDIFGEVHSCPDEILVTGDGSTLWTWTTPSDTPTWSPSSFLPSACSAGEGKDSPAERGLQRMPWDFGYEPHPSSWTLTPFQRRARFPASTEGHQMRARVHHSHATEKSRRAIMNILPLSFNFTINACMSKLMHLIIISVIVHHPLFHNLLGRVRRSEHETYSDKCELHSRHVASRILATPRYGRGCLRHPRIHPRYLSWQSLMLTCSPNSAVWAPLIVTYS